MKKLVSLVLALVFVFSMATVAMAAGSTTTPDQSTVTMYKQYNLTNAGTTSPAETITFTVEKGTISQNDAATWPADSNTTDSVDDGGVTVSSLTLAAGAADGTTKYPVTISLPTYTAVGIYTYNITEVGTNQAGVTYFDGTITLVVTVIEENGKIRVAGVHTENPVSPSYSANSTKNDTFVNTYSAGSLSVTKNVTGNLGDTQKEFNVKVTFTKPNGKTVGSTISYVDGTTTKTIAPTAWKSDGTAEATISLKHGETVTFTNIPYGVTYLVTEDDYTSEDYDEARYTYSDDTNKKIDSDSDTVTITNNKSVDVDTGITLDSLPFVLILAVCAGAAVLFVIKRRNTVEF